LKSLNIILVIFLCLISSGYAAERDVTLQWDESIDAPYLQSYVIYYYTAPGDAGSLNTADYAASYKLAGGSPILLHPLTDPKPITIDKSNTQIALHFLDNSKDYYFVVTAIDTRGLESIPAPEVSTNTSTGSGGGGGGGGGGCFIATAAYGSYFDPQVKILRNFRDAFLLTNHLGQSFVAWYYHVSPPLADALKASEMMKAVVRVLLLPAVGFAYLCLNAGVVPGLLIMIFATGIICVGIRRLYRCRCTSQP
jgi:hypothetical protein